MVATPELPVGLGQALDVGLNDCCHGDSPKVPFAFITLIAVITLERVHETSYVMAQGDNHDINNRTAT